MDTKREKPSIEIIVTWKKSRTWGWCPRAHCRAYGFPKANPSYPGETEFLTSGAYASGCGYDKLSTVVADCLNKLPPFRALLAAKPDSDFIRTSQEHGREKRIAPYGISRYAAKVERTRTDGKRGKITVEDTRSSFDGGVGIGCYVGKDGIFAYLGFSCRHVSSDSVDCFIIEKE